MSLPFVELLCRSNFSFLEGASFPEELVDRAAELGHGALAITDRDGVYGLVRAWKAARQKGLRLICGSILTLAPPPPRPASEGAGGLQYHPTLAVLVQDRGGWANLCHLLTEGRRGQPKGKALHDPAMVLAHTGGLVALLHGPWSPAQAGPFREAFGERCLYAMSPCLHSRDADIVARAREFSLSASIPLVASANVLMHRRERRRVLDVLTCIRKGLTVDQAGRALAPNAERILVGGEDLLARVPGQEWAEAVARSVAVADSCSFHLGELDYRYPRELVPVGHTPTTWLRELCRQGISARFPIHGAPPSILLQVERELRIIEELGFPAYFLTVYDIVAFARRRGILCQGRGSAANSAVCYVLGITSVDPTRSNLLFERFISPERNEPPDIDVDFEHERREEVIQYVYERHGRDRAAMVNEVIAYRWRSAIRDVAKAMGLSPEQVDRLAGLGEWWNPGAPSEDRIRTAGLDPQDGRVRLALELAEELGGFPRHVSIHVGGVVLTDDSLVSRVPIEPARMEDRTVIQWDKDDIDEVGFIKVDLLSLGMLTAIRKCMDLVAAGARPPGTPPPVPESLETEARPFTTPAAFEALQNGPSIPVAAYGARWSLATIPAEDPAVYCMLSRGDSIGVFQVESRAQRSMLPRLRPACFYDLVIEVALVRPGPIQGGMVHPYLQRRNREEPATCPHPRLEPILARTLGVPIFQEQVMAMAVAVADFTPGEADRLRRAIGAWRKRGQLEELMGRLYEGLLRNGIEGDYADRIVGQIRGFGEYGFPESHAASFALLVYVSAWLKCYYPAAFLAALLNAQPMGFYQPATLIADARRHGVEVLPVDVTASSWDCTLEPGAVTDGSPSGPLPRVRLGLRLLKGMGEQDARRVEVARAESSFRGLTDFCARTGLGASPLRAMARAGAFRGLDLGRREAIWGVEGRWPGPLFANLGASDEVVSLSPPTPEEAMRSDYAMMGFSLERHPIGLVREKLRRRGIRSVRELDGVGAGQVVRVAGVAICRQRPGTASGIVFLTLEDETGVVDLVIRAPLYEREREVIRGETLLEATGRLQRDGEAFSILAMRFSALREAVRVQSVSRDFH